VAELREILAEREDRPGLLAEVPGLALSFHEGGLSEPRARAAAHFCREAGADPELIRQWTGTGRERARAAGRASSGASRRIRPGQHPPGRGG